MSKRINERKKKGNIKKEREKEIKKVMENEKKN